MLTINIGKVYKDVVGCVLKILLGVIVLLAGLWLLLPLGTGLPYQGATWDDFKTVFFGLVPSLVVFVGALIIWIEMEDRKGM
jgi:uncharacterized protein YhhL (DUF1145 family)